MEKVFQISSLETFSNACEDIMHNLYNSMQQSSHSSLEPHIHQQAKEDIKKLISSSNFDLPNISETLISKGWSREKVACFISLLEKNKFQIMHATLLNHNSKFGETITDFDWVLKLVMGTNDLKTLSYPLLQLIFSTTNCNGQQKKTVYDVNKETLLTLIKLLENIDDIQ